MNSHILSQELCFGPDGPDRRCAITDWHELKERWENSLKQDSDLAGATSVHNQMIRLTDLAMLFLLDLFSTHLFLC